MIKTKKIFTSFIILFFSFFSINFFNETNAKINDYILIKQKSKILYSWIFNYKKNLIKIKENYDLLEDSVLNKNLKKIDNILKTLKKIENSKLAEKESFILFKLTLNKFNKIKKENSIYLKNILNKVKNPENLKKIKREFDLLAYNSKKISFLLDKLIYKFSKFLKKLPNNKKKENLTKSLKNLYIISLKLKNFRKYIYMWNKPPKKTFYQLLQEIKKELLNIKKTL